MSEPNPLHSIITAGDQIGSIITEHIDSTFRRILPGDDVVVDGRFTRILTGEPHPFGNFACISHPADDAGIRAAIGPLLACSAPAAVAFAGPVPASVVQVLADSGFARHGGLPAMAVDIDQLGATTLPPGYTFERVARAAERDRWSDVFSRGYGLPHRVGAAFARGINDDARGDAPLRYFWVLNNGTPVATSLVYLHNGVAGIYGVATIPEERGKGLGAFATAEPLRIARTLGYRVGVLQSSEEGHPVYLRIGFADFGEVPLFIRMPG